MPQKELSFEVKVDEGKYHLKYYSDGTAEAFRHGEPWPAMTEELLGNKCMFSICLALSNARLAERAVVLMADYGIHTHDSDIEALRDRYEKKMKEWYGEDWDLRAGLGDPLRDD